MERLIARFSWGLITDIQPQDKETQEQIIELLCQREQMEIQMEKDIQKLDKVSLLEKEVNQLRGELTDLHLEVKFLKKALAILS